MLALGRMLALAASVTLAVAQTTAVPACALTCVLQVLPTSPCVSVSNLTCICTNQKFQLDYYGCQQSTCSTADLTAAQNYGVQACQANGTPINVTSAPSGYSSGASSVASSTAAAVSSSSKAASVAATASGTAAPAATSKAANAGKLGVAGALGALLVGGFALLI